MGTIYGENPRNRRTARLRDLGFPIGSRSLIERSALRELKRRARRVGGSPEELATYKRVRAGFGFVSEKLLQRIVREKIRKHGRGAKLVDALEIEAQKLSDKYAIESMSVVKKEDQKLLYSILDAYHKRAKATLSKQKVSSTESFVEIMTQAYSLLSVSNENIKEILLRADETRRIYMREFERILENLRTP